jgi:hypothetical protein
MTVPVRPLQGEGMSATRLHVMNPYAGGLPVMEVLFLNQGSL